MCIETSIKNITAVINVVLTGDCLFCLLWCYEEDGCIGNTCITREIRELFLAILTWNTSQRRVADDITSHYLIYWPLTSGCPLSPCWPVLSGPLSPSRGLSVRTAHGYVPESPANAPTTGNTGFSLRPEQNGSQFADDIFKLIFFMNI